MGGVALRFETAMPPDPCAQDDRTQQARPGRADLHDRAAGQADSILAGPIDATIYATSTAPEALLVATVEDIAPDGTSHSRSTSGALPARSARSTGPQLARRRRRPLLPYHPYTRASASPVPTGAVTRFDIEVFPIVAQLAAGHSCG